MWEKRNLADQFLPLIDFLFSEESGGEVSFSSLLDASRTEDQASHPMTSKKTKSSAGGSSSSSIEEDVAKEAEAEEDQQDNRSEAIED